MSMYHQPVYDPPVTRASQLALLLVVLVPATVEGAGFTQEPGRFYAKVWGRTLVGRGAYIEKRTIATLETSYQDYQVAVYLEAGLLPNITLTLQGVTFGVARFGDETRIYGGGPTAGLRLGLPDMPIPLAVEVQGGWRASSGDPLGAGVVEGRPYEIVPALQTGHGSVEAQAGIPFSWGWASASAGVRWFTAERLVPAVIGSAQIGWDTGIGLVVENHFSLYHSLGEDRVINVLGAANTRYLGVGFTLSWWFVERVAVTASVDGVLYAWANAATPSIVFGFEVR